MFDKLPPDILQSLFSAVGTIVLAWLGRMMFHVRQVQKGKRKFFSIHLWWEVLTALCIGFVADGVASYLGLAAKPAMAVIIVLSYLGPGFVEAVVMALLERYGRPGAGG